MSLNRQQERTVCPCRHSPITHTTNATTLRRRTTTTTALRPPPRTPVTPPHHYHPCSPTIRLALNSGEPVSTRPHRQHCEDQRPNVHSALHTHSQTYIFFGWPVVAIVTAQTTSHHRPWSRNRQRRRTLTWFSLPLRPSWSLEGPKQKDWFQVARRCTSLQDRRAYAKMVNQPWMNSDL